jgi:hypothetical protein
MDEVMSAWVLAGVSAITGLTWFLFWNFITDLKTSVKDLVHSMKGLSDLVQLHDKEIYLMKSKLKIDE